MNIKHALFFAAISVCFSEIVLAQELARGTEGIMNLEDPASKYNKHFEVYSEDIDNGACFSTVIFYERDIATGNEIVTSKHVSNVRNGEYLVINVGQESWVYFCSNGVLEEG